jgi:hypothetical protein
MIDHSKAHQMANSWVRAFMQECEDEFGEEGEQVFAGTIGALIGQLFRLYDPEQVLEHLNKALTLAGAPCRLSRLS